MCILRAPQMLRRSTDKISRISGFRQGWPVIDELEWSDDLYVLYGLAKPPKEQLDWYDHPDDWTR
jgi:hypothetical protein